MSEQETFLNKVEKINIWYFSRFHRAWFPMEKSKIAEREGRTQYNQRFMLAHFPEMTSKREALEAIIDKLEAGNSPKIFHFNTYDETRYKIQLR